MSSKDRIYHSDQFSNTVSVVDSASQTLLGVIKLGEQTPENLSPLYKGQLLVHGMGVSPDHRTLAVVSIGSNSVAFIDTATNVVRHVSYVGRSPHDAMFTQDGKEDWVTVRGEAYVQVLDGKTFEPERRIPVPNGPGMTIFSPDNRYGYVCSSFSPETVVVSVATHRIVGRVKQPSPFCPDIAAAPDGTQVWQTFKDVGKTQVFNAEPPFEVLAVLDTGPITNHVNFARTAQGQFAYVTVGGMNQVKVFTTDATPRLVTTIPMGDLPHGLWPSGDGSIIAVGLENANAVALIDTSTNTVKTTIANGQAPQGMTYISNAVPAGDGTSNLVRRSREGGPPDDGCDRQERGAHHGYDQQPGPRRRHPGRCHWAPCQAAVFPRDVHPGRWIGSANTDRQVNVEPGGCGNCGRGGFAAFCAGRSGVWRRGLPRRRHRAGWQTGGGTASFTLT